MTAIPYGFLPSKALGMVPMAPDHIAELALIEMSRMQRETLERWATVCAAANEFKHADEVAEMARSATVIKLERKQQ